MNTGTVALSEIGRNDPCFCGSGRKYKHCCLIARPTITTPRGPMFDALLGDAQHCVNAGDFANAEQYFRQALALKPNDAAALAGLGQCLCWERNRHEGLAYLHQAGERLLRAARRDRQVDHLVELSSQLLHWGDAAGGMALAHEAAALQPDSAAAHQTLAMCLNSLNHPAEALKASRQAHQLAPRDAKVGVFLAILEARLGNYPRARTLLQEAIAQDNDPVIRARAHLELGAVLDKLGEYDLAFAMLERAGQGALRLPDARGIDRELVGRRIGHNRTGFSPELLNRWPRETIPDQWPAPAFLLGFLRSGTTLTEQVLAAHPGVVTGDESELVYELTEELARVSGGDDNVPANLKRIGLPEVVHLRAWYWAQVVDKYGEEALGRCFVDKTALNTIDIGLINALFPEARVIFALRDPRDVSLSCFMQPFTPSVTTVHMLTWEGTARLYAQVMDLWLHLRDQLTLKCIELRYEDAVFDFEGQYRRVFQLLGLEWLDEVKQFHEKVKGKYVSTPSYADVSKPLYQSSVARWRHYEKHYPPVMPHLERFVDAFGYRDQGG